MNSLSANEHQTKGDKYGSNNRADGRSCYSAYCAGLNERVISVKDKSKYK